MKLVTFTVEPTATEMLLTIVETGFDAIPLHRRRGIPEGWPEYSLSHRNREISYFES
jgi:hypothetical protein